MKKFFTLFISTTLIISGASAAEIDSQHAPGRGAAAGSQSASDSEMAWGFAVGALAVVGAVIGIVASSASQTKTH